MITLTSMTDKELKRQEALQEEGLPRESSKIKRYKSKLTKILKICNSIRPKTKNNIN